MTAGPPAGSPDSRALARWWGQLLPLHPRALWFGHLDLSHLDVLVRVVRTQTLEPLQRLLLRAVDSTAAATLDRLDARLGLGRASLFQWLRDLEASGLLNLASASYTLTATGVNALSTGVHARQGIERRSFTFVALPTGTSHFLAWRKPPGTSPASSTADIRLVTACMARPAEWKRIYDFPVDVTGVESPDAALPAAEAWRRIVVIRAERVPVALAIVAPESGPDRLVGFSVVNDTLVMNEPALELAAGWTAPFPELEGADEPIGAEAISGWHLVGEGRLRRVIEP